MKKGVALGLALAASLPTAAPAQQMEETSMAMPVLSIAFAPTYVADELGFWTKRGLTVKLHDIVGIGSMNAMLAGSVDFTNSSGPTVIRAYIRGQKLLGIGSTGDNLPFDIVLNKDVAARLGIDGKAPIEKRAQALKGLTMSVGSLNSIPHGYLRYFAKKGGLNSERDFKLTPMLSEAAIAALRNGSIDGFVQALPWGSVATRQGHVLLDSAARGSLPDLLPMAFNIVATRPDFCDKKPSVCQKLMDGYLEGMIYMIDNPKESLALLAKKMRDQDPAVTAESFELQRQGTPRTTKINELGLVKAQDLSVEAGMFKEEEKLAKFDAIFTNKFTK
jgi:NitT/TauT family transport system substrate-binding protein